MSATRQSNFNIYLGRGAHTPTGGFIQFVHFVFDTEAEAKAKSEELYNNYDVLKAPRIVKDKTILATPPRVHNVDQGEDEYKKHQMNMKGKCYFRIHVNAYSEIAKLENLPELEQLTSWEGNLEVQTGSSNDTIQDQFDNYRNGTLKPPAKFKKEDKANLFTELLRRVNEYQTNNQLSDALNLLNLALNKNTNLGMVFRTQTGFFSPNESRGFLYQIKQKRTEIENQREFFASSKGHTNVPSDRNQVVFNNSKIKL